MKSVILGNMETNISKTLSDRRQYFTQLELDLEKSNRFESEVQKYLEELENTVKNVKELSQQPEHVALIPLADKVYIGGKIVHTGEYYVEKKAYPESYSVLQTADQTVKMLEDKISAQKEALKKVKISEEQLNERMNLLSGLESLMLEDSKEIIDSEVTSDMPEQIHSDKGVAVKVGGFYEIMEYED